MIRNHPVAITVLGPEGAAAACALADGLAPGPLRPETLADLLADPAALVVIAVDKGVTIGYAAGIAGEGVGGATLTIAAVAEAPAAAGRGIARAVLARLLATARAHGCASAQVAEADAAMRGLYRGLGGVETREGGVAIPLGAACD